MITVYKTVSNHMPNFLLLGLNYWLRNKICLPLYKVVKCYTPNLVINIIGREIQKS